MILFICNAQNRQINKDREWISGCQELQVRQPVRTGFILG